MRIFKYRPLSLFCAVFMLCFALLCTFAGEFKLFLLITVSVVSAVALILIIFVRKLRRVALRVIVCLLAVIAAMGYSLFWYEGEVLEAEKLATDTDREYRIEGYVTELAYETSYSSSFYVRIDSIDGVDAELGARIDADEVVYLDIGQRFEAVGRAESFAENINGYPERKMMISDGYYLLFSTEEGALLPADEHINTVKSFFNRLNSKICAQISYSLPGEGGELVNALLYGNQERLSPELKRDFTRSGVSHLLALSGMHVSILIGSLEILLKKLRTPKLARAFAVVSAAFFYLALTGFSPSITRAVFMFAAIYLAYLFSAINDTLTSLFASCTVILLVSPGAVFDAGLWLSFAATLGIVVFGAPIMKYLKEKSQSIFKKSATRKLFYYTTSSLAMTFCALGFVLFFSMIYFGETSLASPITTLLLSPITDLILIVSLLFSVFIKVPLFATLFGALIELLTDIMISLASFFSSLRGVVISLRYDFAVLLVVLFTLALAAATIFEIKRKRRILFIPCAFVLCFTLCFVGYNHKNDDRMALEYVNRVKSEMVVISDTKSAMICDLSDGSYSNFALALQSAREHCASEVEVFALTHYHRKHITSLDKLMSTTVVRELYLPYPETEADYYIYLSIVDRAEKRGVHTSVYKYSQALRIFGESNITFYREDISRSTHPTLAFVLENSSAKLTYLGASLGESEIYDELMLDAADSHAVIFGLHGPNIKEEYSHSLPSEKTQVILAANAEVAEYVNAESTIFAIYPEKSKFYFKKY